MAILDISATIKFAYSLQKALKDWHMVVIVLCITGAGVLIPTIGWAVPALRAYPALEPNEEIRFGRNVSQR